MAEFRETLTEVKQKIGNPEMTDTELRQHMRQIASTKQTLHPPYDAVVHQIRSLADDAHGYQQRKIRAQFLT